MLGNFARTFPIGKARNLLCKGLLDWQSGHTEAASKKWQQSLDMATKIGMPFEQGQAHFEIGRHLKADDPARKQHLSEAAAIFARLGAVYDLSRTKI